jgi:hypothetical protein
MTITLLPPLSGGTPAPEQVSFDRAELSVILSLYGRMVAAGEWRDYGMSFLRELASRNARACADGRGNMRWLRWTAACSSAATTCVR